MASISSANSETAAQNEAKTNLKGVQRVAAEKQIKSKSLPRVGEEEVREEITSKHVVPADSTVVLPQTPAKLVQTTTAHEETVAQARVALQGLATFIRQQLLHTPAPPKKPSKRGVGESPGHPDARETLKSLLKSVKEQVKALDEPTTNIGDIRGTLEELAVLEDQEQGKQSSRKTTNMTSPKPKQGKRVEQALAATKAVKGKSDQTTPSSISEKREQQVATNSSTRQSGQSELGAASNKSLLEELFPEDAKIYQSPTQMPTRTEREIPRLPLNFDITKTLQIDSPERDAFRHRLRDMYKLGDKLTVLLFRNLSRNLSLSDFHRLVPRGQHLPDWNTGGKFLRVIAGRDKKLERSDVYFVVFKDPVAATKYEENVRRLHLVARTQTPTRASSDASTLPAAKAVVEGVDVARALTHYALAPLDIPLNITTLPRPFSAGMMRMISRGGYAKLAAPPMARGADAPEGRVLMRVGDKQPTVFGVGEALRHDMRRRGMGWGLVDEVENQVEKLDVKAVTTRTHPRIEVSGVKGGGAPGLWSKRDVAPEGLEDGDDADDEPMVNPGFEDEARSRQDTRFLIRFKTRIEAKRFKREWHGRLFPVKKDFAPDLAERHGLVSVEVLW